MRLTGLRALIGAFVVCSVCGAVRAGAQTAAATAACVGGTGGSLTLSDRVSGAYVLVSDEAGVRLTGVILARGQPGWDHGATARTGAWPSASIVPGGAPMPLGGATADTFALAIDARAHEAWVGGRRVPLGGMNVVLFDRADGVGGPPVVLPPIHAELPIPASLAPCGPPQLGALSTTIRELLRRDDVVRAFLDGR